MTAANDNAQRPDQKKALAGRPCPICGKPASPDTAPFCSKRCTDVDLHRWLGGHYAVPGDPVDDDMGEGASSPPTRLE